MKLIYPGLLFAGLWATSPWGERQNTRAEGTLEWTSQTTGPWTPFNEDHGPHAWDGTVRYAAFPWWNITGYQGKSGNAVLFSTQVLLSSLCVLSEGKSMSDNGVIDEDKSPSYMCPHWGCLPLISSEGKTSSHLFVSFHYNTGKHLVLSPLLYH